MSAAMPGPVTRPLTSLGLVAQLAGLLEVSFGSCRGFARFTVGRGTAAVAHHHRVADGFRVLPGWLLDELAFRAADDVRVPLVTFKGSAGSEPLECPGVCVEIPVLYEFSRGRDDYGWGSSPAAIEAATAGISGFSLPVTFFIDAGWSLFAAWLLRTPAPVDHKGTLARVQAVQRRLAMALGGRLDVVEEAKPMAGGTVRQVGQVFPTARFDAWDIRRPSVRLPGSRNRDRGADGSVVTLAYADVAARCSLDELERAVKPKAPKGKGK